MGIVAAIGDGIAALVGSVGVAADVGGVAAAATAADIGAVVGGETIIGAAGLAGGAVGAGFGAAAGIAGVGAGLAADSLGGSLAAGAGTAADVLGSGAGVDLAGNAAVAGTTGATTGATAATTGATDALGAGTAAATAPTTALSPVGATAANASAGVGQTTGALNTLASTGAGVSDSAAAGTAGAGTAGGGAGSASTIGGFLSKYGSLGLGALSAGAQMLGGTPKAAALPNASSVNNGPYFNAALNTNVPGRTAVNPFPSNAPAAAVPTQAPTGPSSPTAAPTGQQLGQASPYWTYGSPEMTYFQGNSLTNQGWPGSPTANTTQVPVQTAAPNPGLPTGMARGGALARDKEFRTGSGNHRVAGPGTETSDSIPAMLSNHEYVLDAEDMRKIGGGDPVRGADRLDRDRRKLGRGRGVLAQFAGRRAA